MNKTSFEQHNRHASSSRNDNKRPRFDNDTKNRVRFQAEHENNDESDDDDEIGPNEPSKYIQTTTIPVYYQTSTINTKTINGTDKLTGLCNKFANDMVHRSRKIREKNESKLTVVPDYRQLMQSGKFSNFQTCTCDHQTSNTKSKTKSSCSKHSKQLNSDSDSSSESSISSISSSSSDEDDGENSTNRTDEKIKEKKNDDEFEDIRSMEISRKQNHPERLHSDLNFNEPDQTNEGPLCKCKLKNTTFGTRHQIYYGETSIISCDISSNNSDNLFHYKMTISPFKNFMLKTPTSIEYDKHKYIFEGFSIFSHEPLVTMPDCIVVIYNHEYKINIVPEKMIEHFTIKELDLIKEYLFDDVLELFDLKWKGYNIKDGCDRVHVMPRFCRKLPYNGKEILSPCEIIKYFLTNNKLLVPESMLKKIRQWTDDEWQDYIQHMQGTIVTYPSKRPSSIRLDQLDRDHLFLKNSKVKSEYPLIIHFNIFRNTWLPMIKNDMKLKKLYHKYFKLRHLLNNKTKLTIEDKNKLRVLGDELQQMIRKSTESNKEIMIELSCENFYTTGLRTDVVQQAVLIPTFVEHIRFHLSLKYLQEKIGYVFKDRLFLQYALTHPSGAFLLHQNLGSNPDHVRNTLNNCRARNPNYGDLTPQKRKSLMRKKGIHMLFSIMSQSAKDNEQSCVSNYERLEFLGDKILELLISKHLFFLFSTFDEGQLSEYRNALVQNQYLAILAKKLDMHYFIIFYHGVDLCSNSALNHALANSFEALLAAVYLDSDLETVSKMLCRILWDDLELRSIWSDLPLHPIQAQQPDGDRYLIKNTDILKHLQQFEEMIGVEFTHIRLLAQAFCTRSASFNLITLGDNQRLEFLGDTVLNFIVSDYLFRHFPRHHEGHLSLLRSSLVCNSTQALLYDELGMADFVLTSFISNSTNGAAANYNGNKATENSGNLKRKADVFEAFIGALYIDQGLLAINTFCVVCMFNKLEDIILYQFWNDPKSRLQQCCLSLRDVDDSKPALPTYKLIEEKGPPNRKQYRVAVYFNRKRIGEGVGRSIHESEVEAAKNALKTKSNMFPILNKYISQEAELMKRNGKIENIEESKERNEEDVEEGECNESNDGDDKNSYRNNSGDRPQKSNYYKERRSFNPRNYRDNREKDRYRKDDNQRPYRREYQPRNNTNLALQNRYPQPQSYNQSQSYNQPTPMNQHQMSIQRFNQPYRPQYYQMPPIQSNMRCPYIPPTPSQTSHMQYQTPYYDPNMPYTITYNQPPYQYQPCNNNSSNTAPRNYPPNYNYPNNYLNKP